jgi:hypothetical protein
MTDEELAEIAALTADLPEVAMPPDSAALPPAASPNGVPSHPPSPDGIRADGRANGASASPGRGEPAAEDLEQPGDARLTERERAIMDLYRTGGIPLEKAAEFLRLAPAEFIRRLESAGAATRA